MRGVRVGENEHSTPERHIVVVQRAAIEEQQGTAASHTRAELVEDAAAHADKVVLSCLCGLDEGEVVQLADGVGEEPREELGRGHLHGRRAGHAGARWYVRCQEGIEIAHLHPELGELVDDSDDIICPGLVTALLRGVGDGKLNHNAFEGIRGQTAGLAVVRRTGSNNILVDSCRKDVALVVVSVIAEDLGTAGSYPKGCGPRAESCRKTAHGRVPQGRGSGALPRAAEALEAA
mmetsp:Transcript_58161/g.173015  ORF Transcript_58161/g.173015 Transcript_58161/m.173015 type:complete len:234 (-) Transcript_58161:7-708(-)